VGEGGGGGVGKGGGGGGEGEGGGGGCGDGGGGGSGDGGGGGEGDGYGEHVPALLPPHGLDRYWPLGQLPQYVHSPVPQPLL